MRAPSSMPWPSSARSRSLATRACAATICLVTNSLKSVLPSRTVHQPDASHASLASTGTMKSPLASRPLPPCRHPWAATGLSAHTWASMGGTGAGGATPCTSGSTTPHPPLAAICRPSPSADWARPTPGPSSRCAQGRHFLHTPRLSVGFVTACGAEGTGLLLTVKVCKRSKQRVCYLTRASLGFMLSPIMPSICSSSGGRSGRLCWRSPSRNLNTSSSVVLDATTSCPRHRKTNRSFGLLAHRADTASAASTAGLLISSRPPRSCLAHLLRDRPVCIFPIWLPFKLAVYIYTMQCYTTGSGPTHSNNSHRTHSRYALPLDWFRHCRTSSVRRI
jgi:hypothetical protein